MKRALAAGLAVLMMAAASPATAEAAANDARIKNNGAYNLLACKDWGKTICAKGSAKKWLRVGETTPKGVDYDGFWLPAGYATDYPGAKGHGPRWVKVSGTNGEVVRVRIVRVR